MGVGIRHEQGFAIAELGVATALAIEVSARQHGLAIDAGRGLPRPSGVRAAAQGKDRDDRVAMEMRARSGVFGEWLLERRQKLVARQAARKLSAAQFARSMNANTEEYQSWWRRWRRMMRSECSGS